MEQPGAEPACDFILRPHRDFKRVSPTVVFGIQPEFRDERNVRQIKEDRQTEFPGLRHRRRQRAQEDRHGVRVARRQIVPQRAGQMMSAIQDAERRQSLSWPTDETRRRRIPRKPRQGCGPGNPRPRDPAGPPANSL